MGIKKIHHLIRYFFFLGVFSFVGYTQHFQDTIFLILTGPTLYIAYTLKSFISPKILKLPKSDMINYYGFLLPICIFYYSFIGFQLKQLVNERGKIKWLILVVFVGFLLYVHFVAFQKLSGYLSVD